MAAASVDAALANREAGKMSDSKPLASLSSSLLARKGQAAPAMRRQALQGGEISSHSLEDLGWNDMGQEELYQQAAPLQIVQDGYSAQAPIVHEQQDALAREFGDAALHHNTGGLTPMDPALRSPAQRAVAGSRGKSAFTLRLDSERHLQLRLVCAMKHRSAQHIVTEALDAFLAKQPEVADLQRQTR